MCIKNKNYMENWLFWGLNLGNLKQCMMIMLVLTSSSSAWTLCSLLHISSLINICNFYSFWATGMVLTSKWGRILQEIHCQCQIWLKWSAAGRRPANFHKRNYLLSVNTTDFEKYTIQAHSAMGTRHLVTWPQSSPLIGCSSHPLDPGGSLQRTRDTNGITSLPRTEPATLLAASFKVTTVDYICQQDFATFHSARRRPK